MNAAAIDISGLSFRYGTIPVLQDVSLTVPGGEYVSIIGPNGAGKSTLLKCLNRIINGQGGTVRLFGKNLDDYSQKDLGKLIGYVPQIKENNFSYTVWEFVMMGRYPYLSPFSRTSAKDKKAVKETLALTELADLASRKMSKLSGGERQKVFLAAALVQQPQILLLDEPTTFLDPKHHVEIQQMVAQVCSKQGITVLHVTHDLNHIFYWSRRVVAIKEGRICQNGTPGEVMTKDNLKMIFDAEFLRMPHPVTNHDIIVPEVHK